MRGKQFHKVVLPDFSKPTPEQGPIEKATLGVAKIAEEQFNTMMTKLHQAAGLMSHLGAIGETMTIELAWEGYEAIQAQMSYDMILANKLPVGEGVQLGRIIFKPKESS